MPPLPGTRPRPASRRSGTAAVLVAVAGVTAVLVAGVAALALVLAPAAPPHAGPTSPYTGPASPSPGVRFSTGWAPFAPLRTHQGQGPGVLTLTGVSGEGLITLTHDGAGAFVVTAAASDGGERLLVDSTGRYTGTRLIGSRDGGPRDLTVRVQADGAWTAITKPLTQAQVWQGSTVQSQGDQVLRMDRPVGRHTTARATHPGAGIFVLDVLGDRTEQQVNATGAYSGEFLLRTGTTFVDVRAQGAWTLTRP
ncbi:hypothetical protein [Nonomuraea monospora]